MRMMILLSLLFSSCLQVENESNLESENVVKAPKRGNKTFKPTRNFRDLKMNKRSNLVFLSDVEVGFSNRYSIAKGSQIVIHNMVDQAIFVGVLPEGKKLPSLSVPFNLPSVKVSIISPDKEILIKKKVIKISNGRLEI